MSLAHGWSSRHARFYPGPPDVFCSDAIALHHEATAAAMRETSTASAALHDAAREKRELIERDAVPRVTEADSRERDR